MVSTNETSEVASAEVLQQQVGGDEIKAITEEEFEKAQKTFQMGKKNLLLNKYADAVNNIEEACKVYSTKFGELDPQCAEIYFFFGRALLELARVENNVLGNALNGVPEDTGPIDDSRYGNPDEVAADEKEEIADKVIDAMCSTEGEQKEEGGKGTAVAEDKKEEVVEKKEGVVEGEVKIDEDITPKETAVDGEKKEGNGEAEGEEEGDEEEEEEEEGDEADDLTKAEGKEGEADGEDISNLQRSWEMFELAKLIYKKSEKNEEKRVAECLLKLGEISIEQEIYDQAITDIKDSIALQEEQKDGERDERMLAESFYQLGLSQQFNNLFTEANESYQKSINILQIRVEKLKGKLITLAENETEDGKLEKTSINDEIAELETLLPELNGKLEEVNEQGQQSLNLIKEAKECFLNNIQNGGTSEFKPTNGECKDITSLMKSKRKISTSEDVANIKKSKTEETAEVATGEKIEVDGEQTTVAEAVVAAEVPVETVAPVETETKVAETTEMVTEQATA